jgi:hypothetical protein
MGNKFKDDHNDSISMYGFQRKNMRMGQDISEHSKMNAQIVTSNEVNLSKHS